MSRFARLSFYPPNVARPTISGRASHIYPFQATNVTRLRVNFFHLDVLHGALHHVDALGMRKIINYFARASRNSLHVAVIMLRRHVIRPRAAKPQLRTTSCVDRERPKQKHSNTDSYELFNIVFRHILYGLIDASSQFRGGK